MFLAYIYLGYNVTVDTTLLISWALKLVTVVNTLLIHFQGLSFSHFTMSMYSRQHFVYFLDTLLIPNIHCILVTVAGLP